MRTKGVILKLSVAILAVFFSLTACNPSYVNKGTSSYNGLNHNLDLEAVEIYIAFNPYNGMLLIKEYRLSTLKKSEAEITEQVGQIKAMVSNAEYCRTRFGFKYFIPISEAMSIEKDRIVGEYYLKSNEENVNKLFEDIFSNVLGREVTITVSTEIGVHFKGLDIWADKKYTKTVLWHEQKKRQIIFWDNGLDYYEMVLGKRNKSQDEYVSILPYFGEDVSSPAAK